jgi:hypothetical protein
MLAGFPNLDAMLKGILRKMKFYVTGLALYYCYQLSCPRRKPGKVILLNLKKNHFKRYLYVFLKFFHMEGYDIYMKKDLKFFCELKREKYAHFLLQEKIIRFGAPPSGIEPLRIGDEMLSPDYFLGLETDSFNRDSYIVPLCQHPVMYHTGWWNEPIENVKRKRSVFMAGNFAREAYSRIERDKVFDVMSRVAVFSFLEQKGLLHTTSNTSDILIFLNSNKDNTVILLDRFLVDIPMNELRNLLAKFDFFFALPGEFMPFSHNVIEAMSSGCIPFIQEQYARLFRPALRNGKQAITFSGIEDLEAKINLLFILTDDEVAEMRKEVNDYYVSYLTPEKVVKEIATSAFKKIYLQATDYSVELLKQRLDNQQLNITESFSKQW